MPYKILYVEDNPDNSLLVQRALEARGYEFAQATRGVEGIEQAAVIHPDIILLDINLPDIDGYEVARQLRGHSDPQVANTPILAITANALRGDAEKAIQSGCNEYMSKPINVRELWARVESLLPNQAAKNSETGTK